MGKFTKIPENTFKQLFMNAGVILNQFNPESPAFELTHILGATSGGNTFNAVPLFKDFGEDIDGCSKGMKELMKLEKWDDISISGNFVTMTVETAKSIVAMADVEGNKVTPRNSLLAKDFADIWLVGDYSDENGETNGGFMAIHLMNALSTGGMKLQTVDKEKGKFAFTYKAHYSMAEQDKVPFEIFVKAGSPEAA